MDIIAEAQTSFDKWFGHSRVVDASGNPLVVYHGTNQTFDKFSKKRGGMSTGVLAGAAQGFFFTNDKEEAQAYAEHAGRTVVSNVAAFEKETERLRIASERLESIAARSGKNSDWDAYYAAHEAWESYEIDSTREDETANLNVITAYLSLQNPLEVRFNGKAGGDSEAGDISATVAQALRDGNDGVIMRNIYDSPRGGFTSDHYVAFSAKQIRRI